MLLNSNMNQLEYHFILCKQKKLMIYLIISRLCVAALHKFKYLSNLPIKVGCKHLIG